MNWILLRGLARESRHWGDFPRRLRLAIPDATLHALDLPGCGARHASTSPSTVEAMVETYRSVLASRGIGAPLHLLGLSLGGMVAASWAVRYPGEVASCVLVNTSMRPWCRWHERLRPRAALALARLAGVRKAERREARILALTSAAPGSHAAVVEEWAGYSREYPVSTANTLRQLLAAARFRAPFRPPMTPLLVLCSRRDALVDPACSMRLAHAWSATLAIHPDAGHDLPLDDGDWVAARIREWLGDIRR